MIAAFRSAWSSSSRRTFVALPLAAAIFEASRRRRPFRGGVLGVGGLALMVGGFTLYRGTGSYRSSRGGGGPGLAVEPDELVTSGPYAVSRNPMYLGHLIFLAGLVGLTRSPLALAGLFVQGRRLNDHVALDERRLADRFGHDYVEYVERVPRWLPRLRSSPYVLFHRIAEPDSARVRLRVVALGLKPRIDFQNAETDGKSELARLGAEATPALWDGRQLISGAGAVERELLRMTGRR